MELRLIIMALVCLCIAQLAFAIEESYPFSSAIEQQRFVTLTKELRCVACQNQNLFDSNAPLALDLRAQIFKLLQAGQSDQQISEYLTSRYGAFIMFKPPLQLRTALLWLGPLFMLGLALISCWRFWRIQPIRI